MYDVRKPSVVDLLGPGVGGEGGSGERGLIGCTRCEARKQAARVTEDEEGWREREARTLRSR